MKTKCVSFDKLSLNELYDILTLRQEVFVVEQNCPYLDADGKDQASFHLLIYNDENNLIAYTRLVPPGISYENYSSIGRVVNQTAERRKGLGKKLMLLSIEKCHELFPEYNIKISAQVYLGTFYSDLGFKEIGDRYLEDNIPHMAMIWKKSSI